MRKSHNRGTFLTSDVAIAAGLREAIATAATEAHSSKRGAHINSRRRAAVRTAGAERTQRKHKTHFLIALASVSQFNALIFPQSSFAVWSGLGRLQFSVFVGAFVFVSAASRFVGIHRDSSSSLSCFLRDCGRSGVVGVFVWDLSLASARREHELWKGCCSSQSLIALNIPDFHLFLVFLPEFPRALTLTRTESG